ncbi:hypothetical protein [Nostoc sp.]|uniref:hypothetical protein n=1 Tax=Nostoc sp. TaxID=1180 RepID=UPI002FFAC0D5
MVVADLLTRLINKLLDIEFAHKLEVKLFLWLGKILPKIQYGSVKAKTLCKVNFFNELRSPLASPKEKDAKDAKEEKKEKKEMLN